MIVIEHTTRQKKIIDIVKENQPITSEAIAQRLEVSRATLRPDLAILTMCGILDARPKVGYFYIDKEDFKAVKDAVSNIKVGEMSSIPVVVEERTSVYDAIVTMFLEDVGTIYVTSDGYLTGVISRKDFLKTCIGGADINKVPVGLIMTRMPNLIIAYPEETMLEAATKIIEHQVDSLPIVEKIEDDGRELYKVIGRVSKTNLTKMLLEITN